MISPHQGRTLVYVGPTIPASRVLELLPQAELRPPVAAADLALESLQAGDRVALIDGVFLQQRAVRHKELAVLLQRGVQLFGAASMGALRAVEMAPFGMVGLGTVVRWYSEGRIDGDDEVALLHGDAQQGYRPLSEALVNLRAGLEQAQTAGSIDRAVARSLLNAWKELPFHERHRPGLIAAAEQQQPGLGSAAKTVLEQHGCDLKRQDAEELLNGLHRGPIPAATASELSTHVRSTRVDRLIPWICWQLRDEPTDPHAGVADSLVLAAARMLWNGYPALQRNTALRAALQDAGLAEPAQDVLQTDITLTDLQREALLALLVQRGLIDHPNELPQLAADFCDDTTTDTNRLLIDVISRSATSNWYLPGMLEALVACGQADHWRRVATATATYLERIHRRDPAFQPRTLSGKHLVAWCREHWLPRSSSTISDQSDRAWHLAMRDRGFNSEAKLCFALAEVFPYARMVSDPFGLKQPP